MKHFPAQRSPARLAGLSESIGHHYHHRHGIVVPRVTAWLILVAVFALGLFSGAIAFGQILVSDTDAWLSALRAELVKGQP